MSEQTGTFYDTAIGSNPAGGLLSSIGGGILSAIGGNRAYTRNKKLLYFQQEFQREMSNTAHQREVRDLREAGLNPILSAKYGGASTPSGGSASAATDVLTPALSTALAVRRQNQELENMKAQESVAKSVKALNEAAREKAIQEAANTAQNIRIKRPAAKIADHAVNGIGFFEKLAKGIGRAAADPETRARRLRSERFQKHYEKGKSDFERNRKGNKMWRKAQRTMWR